MRSQKVEVGLADECGIPDVDDAFGCLVGIVDTRGQDKDDDVAGDGMWVVIVDRY